MPRATDTAANSEVQQPSYKSTGMGDDINVQESRNIFPPSSSSSILNDNQPVQQTRPIIEEIDKIKEDECHEPSNVDKDKHRQYKSFFARVDELKAYKKKHGHLNIRQKEDISPYNFCYNLRGTRRAIITGKGKIHYSLDDSRIAALDAIGFDWNLRDGVSSTTASQDDKFFAQVDKLRAFKEKHGHLNVRPKDDLSLAGFCYNVRQARIGKGTYRLEDGRVSALDAIGFDWNPGISKDDKFFAQVDELKFYKQKHGHLTVRQKEDRSLYDFCCRLKRSRRAIIAGKRKKMDYRLDGDRIAALDAIGFEWELDCKV